MEENVKIEVTGEMEPPQVTPDTMNIKYFIQNPYQLPQAKEWILSQRQHIRPWLLFLQTSNFKMPPSLPRLSKRIMRNIEFFQANYLFIFLGLIAYCLITSPLVLIAIAGSFYVGRKLAIRHQEKQPFVICGKQLTLAQQYGLVAACSMPIYYLVGAHAAMFWVLGASFTVITIHAAFYNIDAVISEDRLNLLENI